MSDQWQRLDNDEFFDDGPTAISTGLKSVNQKFFPIFNGIPIGGITEIVGLPGSGKTSFAIQVAIQALALDPSYSVIYIDASSNFSVERFNQIYKSQPRAPMIPVSDFLDRFILLKAVDIFDVFLLLFKLENLIKDLARVDLLKTKLVIIDNVASPFRLFPSKSVEYRIKVIDKFACDLRSLASKFQCAILSINQLTTKKIQRKSEETDADQPDLKPVFVKLPSLGQTWQNRIDSSILLRTEGNSTKFAELIKSVYCFSPLIPRERVSIAKKPIRLELGERGFFEIEFDESL